jgi:hypothetical protein
MNTSQASFAAHTLTDDKVGCGTMGCHDPLNIRDLSEGGPLSASLHGLNNLSSFSYTHLIVVSAT